MRDDFMKPVVNDLAKRAGYTCSNPTCQRSTVGPDGATASASIGVAAHITAASVGGPRYDPTMSAEHRASIGNGIWLCQTCSRLIDSDGASHPIEMLNEWKKLAEMRAYLALRGLTIVQGRSFVALEAKMPELIAEMREDIKTYPFTREFIIFSKKWSYSGSGKMIFSYFFEDHEHLQGKMKMCENYGAVVDIAFNDVERFEFTEEFVEFLLDP